MPVIFFALISYLGWGIGDIFGTIATRKIGAYSTTFWYLFLGLILSSFYGIFILHQLKDLTLSLLILNLFLGILGLVGLIAFYEALRIGSTSVVGSIVASFAAVTVVLSIIFLKESITITQVIFILTIFLGVLITTVDLQEVKKQRILTSKRNLFAILAMITFGIYWTFIKIPVHEIGWFWPSYISTATFPLVLVFMKFKKMKLKSPYHKKSFFPVFANTVLLSIAAFSFNFAIDKGLTAIVAPIAGSYVTLFVVLAFLIFKDPITRQQILGIIITLIGIVLLSFFSV